MSHARQRLPLRVAVPNDNIFPMAHGSGRAYETLDLPKEAWMRYAMREPRHRRSNNVGFQ